MSGTKLNPGTLMQTRSVPIPRRLRILIAEKALSMELCMIPRYLQVPTGLVEMRGERRGWGWH